MATSEGQKIAYLSFPFDSLIHYSHFSLPSFLFGLKKNVLCLSGLPVYI